MSYEFYIGTRKRIIIENNNICCEMLSEMKSDIWLKCDVKPETVLYFITRGLNELGMIDVTSCQVRINLEKPEYNDFLGTPEEKAVLYVTEKNRWDHYVKDFYDSGIIMKSKRFFV